jgi:hypothetical protein
MRKQFTIALTVLLFTFPGSSFGQSKTEMSLQKERADLARSTNPVERTKINIKISDLLIVLLTDAARAGDDKMVEQNLTDYTNTIQDARLTMVKTGKDAHKHPAGFKELEISLRKQQSKLTDAGRLMEYEQREAVDKVRKLASDISDQLVKMMLLKDPNATHK